MAELAVFESDISCTGNLSFAAAQARFKADDYSFSAGIPSPCFD
jgi:hypothetical protein